MVSFTSYYDPSDGAAVAAALLIFGVVYVIILAVFYVLGAVFCMRLFDKAGVEGKWRAWVPVYNSMIFVKLGDLNPWWLLVLGAGTFVLSFVYIGWLVGIALAVYLVLAAYRIQVKLGKETPWIILYIFLPLVWLGIMAFDRSRWSLQVPPAPWANNFLADKTVWNGIPVQTPVGGYAAPGAPGAYPPPAGYQAPPPGYSAPPASGAATPPAAHPAQPPVPPTEPPAAPDEQPRP